MKIRNLISTIGTCFLFFAVISPSSQIAAVDKPAPHVRASSLTSQFPTQGFNIANIEHIDSISDIDHPNDTQFIIKSSGTYFVSATGQAGIDVVAPPGYLDLWLLRNGTPIPNTGSRTFISNKSTASIVSQTMLELNKNDIISVGYKSTSGSIGLIATDSTSSNISATPSVTFSLFQLK